VDYHDLKHEETRKTSEGIQLEKYRDKKDGSYTVLYRTERFGPIQKEANRLQEADADQILAAAESGEVKRLLEGGRQ
jgi:hypothetical protein